MTSLFDPATLISYKTAIFPPLGFKHIFDVWSIFLMFLCSIFMWPCDDGLSYIQRTYQFWVPTIIHSWDIDDSNLSYFHDMWRSLRKHCVVWCIIGGGGGNDPHFWNPWPQFIYSLCHFQGATKKIKPRYWQKIAFITLWRLQSSLRMRRITWPVYRWSPQS